MSVLHPNQGKNSERALGPLGIHVRLFAGSQRREATTAAINIDRATEAAAGPEPRDPDLRRWGGGVGGSFGLGLEKSVFYQARKRI